MGSIPNLNKIKKIQPPKNSIYLFNLENKNNLTLEMKLNLCENSE